jgi:hypothetical protein
MAALYILHGFIVLEPSAYMNSSGATNFRQTARSKVIHGKR